MCCGCRRPVITPGAMVARNETKPLFNTKHHEGISQLLPDNMIQTHTSSQPILPLDDDEPPIIQLSTPIIQDLDQWMKQFTRRTEAQNPREGSSWRREDNRTISDSPTLLIERKYASLLRFVSYYSCYDRLMLLYLRSTPEIAILANDVHYTRNIVHVEEKPQHPVPVISTTMRRLEVTVRHSSTRFLRRLACGEYGLEALEDLKLRIRGEEGISNNRDKHVAKI
ncbi:hypothetical protein CC80DRAFT_502954 [Byssothecium circinans]|uniref:Uncharacterized protein n=1 Tax=Byssothecium circinans TaxID=147558 RepID=A0A6A5U1K5_9PLEO|nr:hypothetical protein CC80DRAFT_502954 [Byssothecium circinans]